MLRAVRNANTLFILVYIVFVGLTGSAQKVIPFYGPFPYPSPNKNRLFYLQRSLDRNTVIYELNHESDGELNAKKPVKVYWIDFEEGAKTSPLTFAQNKFAYGIESEQSDHNKKIYTLHLVSYRKISMHLKPDGEHDQYRVHVLIKGKPAILNRVFVNIIGGTYFKPVVSYIELSGVDLQTGAQVSEKIKTD